MAGISSRELRAIEKSRIRRWIKLASERAVSSVQIVIAAGGLIIVLLLSIPWMDGPLKKLGLDSPGTFSQTVITIMVVSIFFDLRRLNENKTSSYERHFPDPMDVYPVLFERARLISRAEERTIEVLGLTLYTAWPSIRFWLNRSELNGWTVRFTAFTSNQRHLAAHVPDSWFREARANLDSITEYAHSAATQAKHITLKAYTYDFMPSLHGYRLGNGDLFFSIVRWQESGQLSLDNYTYEFVPRDDTSPSAEAIREIFDSWFRRATVTEWRGKTP